MLVNNGGGGIFDFLPVADAAMAGEPVPGEGPGGEDLYTRHIATPPRLDFAMAAALFRLRHELVADRYASGRLSSARWPTKARR